MTLIRQMVALLAAVLLLALAGSVTMNVVAARDTLKAQLRLKNADNAASLALALSQHHGDATAMALLMAAQFDTGHYRLIRLVGGDGQTRFERQGPPRNPAVPAWFVAALPVAAPAGVAQVSDGWRDIGRLEVESQTAYVHDALWAGAVSAAEWLLAVGLAAGALALLGVRALQRPLQATVDQAAALAEGRFVVNDRVPTAPELRTLTEAMNALVNRLRRVFDEQARQVAQWREQAEHDPLTGLSNRRHFLGRLGPAMASGAGALVLLRVADLDGLNRRHGRAVADDVLRAVAQALSAYPSHVPGGFAGRLNGADFALYLPADGVAAETAQALVQGLRALLPARAADASVCAGSAELATLAEAGVALAAADDALALAEADGPYVARHHDDAGRTPLLADDAWRRRLDDALTRDGLRLDERVVSDVQNQTRHLQCELCWSDGDDAGAGDAAQWRSHALRSRRAPRLDLRTLELALAASAADGQVRRVSFTADALLAGGWVAEVRHRLDGGGAAAALLMLELPDRLLSDQPLLLREAVQQWSRSGVQIGLHHAGVDSHALARLYELGLRFVGVDHRHLDGVADDEQVRQFAAGLLALLRGMGLAVFADARLSAADARALRALGFDGTGAVDQPPT